MPGGPIPCWVFLCTHWQILLCSLTLYGCRLQAALAGSEAARRQLEAAAAQAATYPTSHSQSTAHPHSASYTESASKPAAVGTAPSSSSSYPAAAAAAKLAEAQARATALQRQLDTERLQSSGAVGSLQEEVALLKASVAQEKGERARLLSSLRESMANIKSAGDGEVRVGVTLSSLLGS